MNKFLLAIAASLAAGLAAGAWLLAPRNDDPAPPVAAAPVSFDASAAVEDRIAALEAAVSEEREARRVLEDELIALYEELDTLRAAADPGSVPPPGFGGSMNVVESGQAVSFSEDRSRGPEEDYRRQAMIDAGFSPQRADYILERESALQYQQMQARYQARNAENPREAMRNMIDAETALRDELGEADYEKYLAASGQSTSVGGRNVMSSSPAAVAGLQPGDQIVRYDGERVYSQRDLMVRTWGGDGTGSVVVEVLRDGVPMQVTLPRGPIGIEIGRGR